MSGLGTLTPIGWSGEMADAADLKSAERNLVRVRIPFPAFNLALNS